MALQGKVPVPGWHNQGALQHVHIFSVKQGWFGGED